MSVDLAVVQPKRRLTGGDVDVAAGVAPDAIMAADVEGCLASGRVLERVLELADGAVAGDVVEQVLGPHVRGAEEVADVAA